MYLFGFSMQCMGPAETAIFLGRKSARMFTAVLCGIIITLLALSARQNNYVTHPLNTYLHLLNLSAPIGADFHVGRASFHSPRPII